MTFTGKKTVFLEFTWSTQLITSLDSKISKKTLRRTAAATTK